MSGLLIRNITQADDGNYTCRAEVEADGRYNERTITVIVHSTFFVHSFIAGIYIAPLQGGNSEVLPTPA